MSLFNKFARATRKIKGLPAVKAFNRAVRKFSANTHYFQHLVEWSSSPHPEWYDHFLDQHWGWSKIGTGMPWERGVFSSLTLLKNGKALELCCGDGFNAYHFYAIHLDSIISVDFDGAAIEHARNNFKNPKITYEVCDIRTSIPSGEFDNVIWDAAIEHFTESEISKIISDIKERLTDKGILSGYTITTRPDGKKMHHDHEYEFSSKEDLMRVLSPHFQRVRIFETDYPDRHNLYFYASERAPLPFDADWDCSISK
jgi:ubiquinone/menaquinone biosynthesis C-methylase UbiE